MRLVVYAGPPRVPTPIFNEKVLAGLGSSRDRAGRLPEEPRQRAFAALSRFKLLVDHMKVKQARVVATAAIRDASDGPDFVRDLKRIGLDCEILSAGEEARLAGEGVLSGIPGAKGVVGDLGGGSLELVGVGVGTSSPGISMPLGVLRVDPSDESAVRKILRTALRDSGIREQARGRSFYMVGGSWRALARIDMQVSDFPLPITHQYRMKPTRARELRKLLGTRDPELGKSIAPARLASSPVAAMLLELLVEELEPSQLVVSTYGIREGLLFSSLPPKIRSQDPLIEEARCAGGSDYRFGQHGDLLDHWIAPLFEDPAHMRRLRLAACLLADVAWQANPGFRAERAIELALHGNWVAIDPGGRVILAEALASTFGEKDLDPAVTQLCRGEDLVRAHCWGVAMRLGQRLSGGVGAVLKRTSLSVNNGAIQLHTRRGEEALVGDQVERRLIRLGEALGCEVAVVSG